MVPGIHEMIGETIGIPSRKTGFVFSVAVRELSVPAADGFRENRRPFSIARRGLSTPRKRTNRLNDNGFEWPIP
jgi:hypothetical protein